MGNKIRFFSACLSVLLSFSLCSGAVFAEDTLEPEIALAGTVASSSGTISVKELKSVAEDYNVPDEFLDAVAKKKNITVKQLKQYAQKYKLPAQYVQRFVTDAFVFKKGDELEYLPIDDTLPKNSYDWDNLVRTEKEIKYQQNGKNKALKGIDVSEFQGDINWKKVKADGVKYAFVRVGYRGYGSGTITADQCYEQNLEEAAAAGVKVGAYFFSQAVTTAEAVEEANFLLDCIDGYDITYPVVYDLEDAPTTNARTYGLSVAQATKNAKAFCNTIKKAGYRPMIYTNATWTAKRYDMQQLKGYDIWLAQYYNTPFYPYKFQIWQYSGQGKVKGINGNADLNLSFVDYAKKS